MSEVRDSDISIQPPPPPSSNDSQSDLVKQRFLLLKKKMSKIRDENVKEVVKEDRILEDTSSSGNKAKWKKMKKKGKKKRKRKYDLSMTAEESEYHKKKKQRKDKDSGPSGWGVYSDEHKYRVYLKRCKDLPTTQIAIKSKEEKRKRKKKKKKPSTEKIDSSSSSSEEEEEEENLDSKFQEEANEEGKERLVEHLRNMDMKRKKFNRRRTFLENQKINYINERNRKYNRKIEKAYGQFTKDLRKAIDETPRF